MIRETVRSFLIGSLVMGPVGFAACSDEVSDDEGTGGTAATSGGAVGSGGKATGTGGAKGGATGVGGGTAGTTATGNGGTAGGAATGNAGTSTAGTGGTTSGVGGASTGGISAAGSGTGGSVAGAGGTAGSAGVAGSPGVCNSDATVTISSGGTPQLTASGVLIVSVPLKAVGEGQRYNYQNYDGLGTYDLSCARLNILAAAPGAIGGNLHIAFMSFGRAKSSAFDVPLSALTSGFTTISIPVPPAMGGYDPAILMSVPIEIEAGAAFGTSWQTPSTVIYIDRIWTTNGLFDDYFNAAPSISIFNNSGARPLAGSSNTWAIEVNLGAGGGGGAAGAGQAGTAGIAGTANLAGSTGLAGAGTTAGSAGSAGGGGAAGAG